MYNPSFFPVHFFSTRFGRAALISIAAMLALNVAVLTRPAATGAAPQIIASSAAVTGELA